MSKRARLPWVMLAEEYDSKPGWLFQVVDPSPHPDLIGPYHTGPVPWS